MANMAEPSVIPQTAALIEPESRASTQLAGVLVMSFSSLLLELALTRLFSVILFYHFAFLAISIALLGLGAGGAGVRERGLRELLRGSQDRDPSPGAPGPQRRLERPHREERVAAK